jgi:hypothetical protein
MYPTYRFQKGGGQCRVENEDEDRALGEGWFDHPPSEDEVDMRFPAAKTQEDPDTDEVDDMLAEEDTGGIEGSASDDGTPRKKKKKKK